MNSFIAWIGGKKLLRKNILAMFPQKDEYDRYIEVFGGAGWVLFGREIVAKHLEVFNDIDSDLINLYRCIKFHCEELQRELEWLLISREQFFDAKSQMDNRGLTDIQRAARYFFIIKASFGADKKTFGNNKKNLQNAIEHLAEIKERLKYVVVENRDYASLIKVYDRDKALFYLDPPYHGTEKYYNSGFCEKDHINLRDILVGLKGKFILSYNDDEFIRELYKNFEITSVSRSNSLVYGEKGNQYKEVIIKNF